MTCIICNQGKPIKAKGMCNACYLRDLKKRNPEYKKSSYESSRSSFKKRCEVDSEYYENHKSKNRKRCKKAYYDDVELTRERSRERNKKFRQTEHAKMKRREYQAARRAKTRNHVDFSLVLSKYGNVCGICGEEIDISLKHPHKFSLAFDHIVPLSKGGLHIESNLQPSHFSCNSSKKDSVL